jgi:PAS domain S-box-containing protein
MIVTDAKGVILRANQAFSRLTGYSLQEVLGRKLAFLNSGRHTPAFFQSMWQALKKPAIGRAKYGTSAGAG